MFSVTTWIGIIILLLIVGTLVTAKEDSSEFKNKDGKFKEEKK